MSNYVKSTNFTTKDTLNSGDPNKIVKGTELDTEFIAIASAVSSKADLASPAFTGVPTSPTAAAFTNTAQVATTAFIQQELTRELADLGTMSTQNSNAVDITGGYIAGIADLAIADGGTGSSTAAGARSNLNVPTRTGGDASGSWNINAATVTDGVYNSAFTGSNQSKTTNGYQKLPGGLIIQWGLGNSESTVTFPIAFPNACLNVTLGGKGGYYENQFVGAITNTTVYLGGGYGPPCYWMAIGY